MTELPPTLNYAAPKTRPRPSLARVGAIAIVALLPAGIGWFHLYVHALVPYSGPRPPAVSSQQPGSSPFATPGVTGVPVGVARARHRIDTTLPLVFLSCMAACLALGLLNAPRPLAFAFLQACVASCAHILSDGQGACFGPIAFTIVPFLPLIWLGRAGRRIIVR